MATPHNPRRPRPSLRPSPPPPAPETQASAPADARPEAAAPAARRTEPEVAAPGFDVVRVEPDGAAAVVGTAEPGAKVTIYADEAPLAEAEADAQGNFVAIFKVEPSPEPRALTLGSVTPEGDAATSDDVVMLLPGAGAPAPDAAPEAEVAAAMPPPAAPAPEAAREPGAAEAAAEPAPAAAPEDEPAAEPEPGPRAGGGGDGDRAGRHGGGDADRGPMPAGARRVTLGTVSYAEAGEVTLAGAGTAGAVVRAYVDDRFAEEARVAADGRWSMQLGDVAEGIYRLRIDQLADDGKVASRVETPFQRDYPRPPPPRPGRAGGHCRVGDGAAGPQPLDFGANALWFGRALHPDLHREPRPDTRPGPDLSRADLQHAGAGRSRVAGQDAPRPPPRAPAPAAGGPSAGSRPTSGRRASAR